MNQEVSPEVEKKNEEKTNAAEPVAEDGEFKITVKKLEMPVRPRGVLAE